MKRMISCSIHTDDIVYVRRGMYAGQWGKVVDFDGDYYYVAIWGDTDSVLVFEPNELTLKATSN